MFCPECRSEYRSGFTRCQGCGVDLVASLDTVPSAGVRAGLAALTPPTEPVTEADFVSYCGFLSLDDARGARDALRRAGLRTEIAVREAAAADLTSPVSEEYWIRVVRRDVAAVANVLGYDADEPDEPDEADHADESDEPRVSADATGETFACSECGKDVGVDEAICPHCGAQFE